MTTEQGNVTVLAIQGSIDALTANEVQMALSAEIGKGHLHLAVDLSGVDFMSSAGLRCLLAGLKEARQAGGDIRLAGAQPVVEKILKLAGFTSILWSHPTVAEAVQAFNR